LRNLDKKEDFIYCYMLMDDMGKIAMLFPVFLQFNYNQKNNKYLALNPWQSVARLDYS
jgi:hypothetical protein